MNQMRYRESPMTVSLTGVAMLSPARCIQGATCPW